MSKLTNLELLSGVNPEGPLDASGALALVPGQTDSTNNSLLLAGGINPLPPSIADTPDVAPVLSGTGLETPVVLSNTTNPVVVSL